MCAKTAFILLCFKGERFGACLEDRGRGLEADVVHIYTSLSSFDMSRSLCPQRSLIYRTLSQSCRQLMERSCLRCRGCQSMPHAGALNRSPQRTELQYAGALRRNVCCVCHLLDCGERKAAEDLFAAVDHVGSCDRRCSLMKQDWLRLRGSSPFSGHYTAPWQSITWENEAKGQRSVVTNLQLSQNKQDYASCTSSG